MIGISLRLLHLRTAACSRIDDGPAGEESYPANAGCHRAPG